MDPLELVRLTSLMERTNGSPDVRVGLIDGPVATDHPALARESLRDIGDTRKVSCARLGSQACLHGTVVAGILSARRHSSAPAICPGCTLVVRPIFAETTVGSDQMPSTTPRELAEAMVECIEAGTRVLNLSLALARPSTRRERPLEDALDHARQRRVIVVAAAGNQGTLGSSVITRHPWVIPVVSCDREGRSMFESNLAWSIGLRGISAPGDAVTSLSPEGEFLTIGGTSVAVPFVTGTIALLWSAFPSATAMDVTRAVTRAAERRASLVPPLLDAAAAYRTLVGCAGRSVQYDQNTEEDRPSCRRPAATPRAAPWISHR